MRDIRGLFRVKYGGHGGLFMRALLRVKNGEHRGFVHGDV